MSAINSFSLYHKKLYSQDAQDVGEIRDKQVKDVDELSHLSVSIGDVVLEVGDELNHGLENGDDALRKSN